MDVKDLKDIDVLKKGITKISMATITMRSLDYSCIGEFCDEIDQTLDIMSNAVISLIKESNNG